MGCPNFRPYLCVKTLTILIINSTIVLSLFIIRPLQRKKLFLIVSKYFLLKNNPFLTLHKTVHHQKTFIGGDACSSRA
jgi:hypothetical protein